MKKPTISLISAINKKTRAIGKEDGGLIFKISEDMKHFRETTTNHPIIMGKNTWEEFREKPLPNRTHIIVTRDTNYKTTEGVLIAHSIEEAIKIASEIDREEIFIIGGGQIYALGLPYADRLYLTLIDSDIDGPVKFPDYESASFTKIVESRKSSREGFEYEFVTLEKK